MTRGSLPLSLRSRPLSLPRETAQETRRAVARWSLTFHGAFCIVVGRKRSCAGSNPFVTRWKRAVLAWKHPVAGGQRPFSGRCVLCHWGRKNDENDDLSPGCPCNLARGGERITSGRKRTVTGSKRIVSVGGPGGLKPLDLRRVRPCRSAMGADPGLHVGGGKRRRGVDASLPRGSRLEVAVDDALPLRLDDGLGGLEQVLDGLVGASSCLLLRTPERSAPSSCSITRWGAPSSSVSTPMIRTT